MKQDDKPLVVGSVNQLTDRDPDAENEEVKLRLADDDTTLTGKFRKTFDDIDDTAIVADEADECDDCCDDEYMSRRQAIISDDEVKGLISAYSMVWGELAKNGSALAESDAAISNQKLLIANAIEVADEIKAEVSYGISLVVDDITKKPKYSNDTKRAAAATIELSDHEGWLDQSGLIKTAKLDLIELELSRDRDKMNFKINERSLKSFDSLALIINGLSSEDVDARAFNMMRARALDAEETIDTVRDYVKENEND